MKLTIKSIWIHRRFYCTMNLHRSRTENMYSKAFIIVIIYVRIVAYLSISIENTKWCFFSSQAKKMWCLLKWFSENLRKKLCKCIPLLNYFTCPTATAGLIIGKYILIKWRFTRMLWNFKIILFWVSPAIKTNYSVFVEILSGEHVAVLFPLLCEVAFDAKLGKWFFMILL